MAQSVQFSKIAKKLNIDLSQFFLIERKHCPYWNHETKDGGHRTRFCGSCRKCSPKAFSSICGRGLGRDSKWHVCERGKKIIKNSFLQNLHRDITVRTQCATRSVLIMKIKMSKYKLTSTRRGSPWGSRTQQHAYCLRYAHSQHTQSHLGKKQPQAKIPIEFLFSELHLNNVTSDALFYGGHLVMRSKRCAEQNQWNTLTRPFPKFELLTVG